MHDFATSLAMKSLTGCCRLRVGHIRSYKSILEMLFMRQILCVGLNVLLKWIYWIFRKKRRQFFIEVVLLFVDFTCLPWFYFEKVATTSNSK